MNVPRHWREQIRRYRLVGSNVQTVVDCHFQIERYVLNVIAEIMRIINTPEEERLYHLQISIALQRNTNIIFHML